MTAVLKSRLWYAAIGILSIGIIAAAFFLLSQSSLLAIDTIEVEGNRMVSTETVDGISNPVLRGQSMLNPSIDDVREALAELPFVEYVEFDRRFPNTMHILIGEHQPGVSYTGEGGGLFLLSSKGRALMALEVPVETLPLLTTAVPCVVEIGDDIGCDDAQTGIQFINDIPMNFNHEFAEVMVKDGDIRAKTRSGINVHFGSLDDYGLKFEVLRQLLARAAAEGVIVTIDVSVPERPVTREDSPAPPPTADGEGASGVPEAGAADGGEGTAHGTDAVSGNAPADEAATGNAAAGNAAIDDAMAAGVAPAGAAATVDESQVPAPEGATGG